MIRSLLLILFCLIYSEAKSQIQYNLLSHFPSVIDENSQVWNISLNERHFLINRGDETIVYLYKMDHANSLLVNEAELHIRKGRGPGESTALTYAELSDEQVLMLSPNEHKYLLYNISDQVKEEFTSTYSFASADFSNDSFYLYPQLNPEIIFARMNDSSQPRNLDFSEIDADYFAKAQRGKNFYYHTGKPQQVGSEFVQTSHYWPYFLKYNEKGTGYKTWFDEVSDYEPLDEYSNGSRILLPPQDPDISLKDFSVIQIDQQFFYALVYKGRSNKQEYGLKKVVILDQNLETAATLSTDRNIDHIDTFSHYLGILFADRSVSIYDFKSQ